MQYSSIPLAQSITLLCLSKGIKHVVISPGSRNAPLTISFSNHPDIEAYSVVDERSAAFFALGLAQQLKEPVALCCSSGSALLNYYPAIAEAYYSDVPLVVISADRPVERIDIGDGQTIRQKNVYQNHILYSANLYSELVLEEAVPIDPKLKQKLFEAQKHNEREINLALNMAIEQNGPVHVNAPFYEPLYQLVEKSSVAPLSIEPIREPKTTTKKALQPYAEIWNKAKKKLVLVGVNKPNAVEQAYLDWLAEDPSVLVFTETTSNLHHEKFITRIDKLIAPIEASTNKENEFQQLQPDLLLTFGGLIISKKIKAFLRTYQPKHHWHVDAKKAFDTFFCLNKHFDVNVNEFFNKFSKIVTPVESNYRDQWLEVNAQRDVHHDKYMEEIPFCDLKAFRQVLQQMPEEQVVHLSNSSVVRYAQLFRLSPSLQVYCNRGTSGIDGSSSTAVGASVRANFPTTLITGDISFLYDSNALWNNYIPKSFRIIIINNQGGGIFRILPGAKEAAHFSTFFETTHNLRANHLAEMYNFSYQAATDEKSLKNELIPFYAEGDRPKILEIFTPREDNDQYLKNYFKVLLPES
ncbi:2-succinyl-5-enolpyruvyl-6-hydroxy-3-cyclohexene-1-carboxylic-acid synthase [Mesonia aestuariivivens]|uniref:2-succinyl-5-enolpyruvyl-6-hydroxy-3-cyclohexene-1-carboxylate synthase n=1 Tax=Mesonia aestuariivivens TaxID=2796128 RepID=A0ABS6W0W7_9FLAO|nr:2-succinyl-5-enolpyruvyl-6-hydroxy-3-cyclohexene-1-carboxylic-acid synthase [Mesonia aestuariivivens]MBW2961399.1 2-succinyl-5-enolpyruvyl-6-hydroxy-3-cyclohexene-1-carboxylic-acid synthase [Mesonia aestuariivivens]